MNGGFVNTSGFVYTNLSRRLFSLYLFQINSTKSPSSSKESSIIGCFVFLSIFWMPLSRCLLKQTNNNASLSRQFAQCKIASRRSQFHQFAPDSSSVTDKAVHKSGSCDFRALRSAVPMVAGQSPKRSLILALKKGPGEILHPRASGNIGNV